MTDEEREQAVKAFEGRFLSGVPESIKPVVRITAKFQYERRGWLAALEWKEKQDAGT